MAFDYHDFAEWLVSAIVGGIVSIFLWELTRTRRKRRLLMGPAMMPSFVVTVEDKGVTIDMFGDYGVVNMSDLPITLDRPRLLGYNAASRAFQFTVMPIGKLFEKVTVSSNDETVLISHKECRIDVERFSVRAVPGFLWIETLELVRLGSRHKFRDRAYLYRLNFVSREERKVWYKSAGVEVSSTTARLLALPGKWLYRHTSKRAQK